VADQTVSSGVAHHSQLGEADNAYSGVVNGQGRDHVDNMERTDVVVEYAWGSEDIQVVERNRMVVERTEVVRLVRGYSLERSWVPELRLGCCSAHAQSTQGTYPSRGEYDEAVGRLTVA
jgi:hypothetical protein